MLLLGPIEHDGQTGGVSDLREASVGVNTKELELFCAEPVHTEFIGLADTVYCSVSRC